MVGDTVGWGYDKPEMSCRIDSLAIGELEISGLGCQYV